MEISEIELIIFSISVAISFMVMIVGLVRGLYAAKILGGGVMHQTHLFDRIYKKTQIALNKYIQSKYLEDHIRELITPPLLKDDSGIIGALNLAMEISL